MKRFFTISIIILFCFNSNSQEYIPADNFKFKFIKAKKAVGSNYYYTIKTPKNMKRTQVRLKMKSLSEKKEDFDPNKFYLVSDKYKTRVRPIDVRYNYAVGWIFIGFRFIIDFEPKDEKIKEWFPYKPEIENTFNNYKMEGYEDVICSIDFGTKRKPMVVSPYLDHEKLNSCKIDLYFSLPKDLEKIKVYYGNILITDTIIK